MDIKHLTTKGKKFIKNILRDYQIDDAAGQTLLLIAAEAFERCEEARLRIKKEGSILIDRFGQQKTHPSIAIERDSRQQVIAALRALNLNPGGKI